MRAGSPRSDVIVARTEYFFHRGAQWLVPVCENGRALPYRRLFVALRFAKVLLNLSHVTPKCSPSRAFGIGADSPNVLFDIVNN